MTGFPVAPPVAQPPGPTRPRAVETGVRLTMAGVVIGAIGTIVTLLLDRAWVDRTLRGVLAGEPTPPSGAEFERMRTLFVTMGVLGAVLLVGVVLLFCLKARAGRPWARMLLAVLAVFAAVSFLAAVSEVGPAPDLTWNLADAAFRVAGAVHLFLPASVQHFTPGKKIR